MESANKSGFLTVPEVAKHLRCGTRPVYRAIKAGELKAVAVNERGDLRIADAWMHDWIERLSARPACII